MFAIASAIWGFGFGTFNPAIALKVIASVPKQAATRALAILTCAMGIGQFISPMSYSFINNLAGFEGSRASWNVAMACFVAALLISPILIALRQRRSNPLAAG